ncbi:MAG TPA: hypothetical protein VGN57_17840 [Pirellulaceae bacterium]|jgi:hypothetical protein|nr:hypothetical protein [Pirellulaceae bacterium]
MLRISEFGMLIDATQDCGLASHEGLTLYGPMDGSFGVGITRPQSGDDPQGNLEEQYALMAALGPVGDKGATFLNRKGDAVVPFVGAIRNPHTEQLYLLIPYNNVGLDETELRRAIAGLVVCIGFVSPAMELWENVLRGRTFTAGDHYQRQLGSGDGASLEETIAFHTDGLYERRTTGHVSVSSGGLSLGRVRDDRETGRWDVVETDGSPALRLESAADGERTLWSLGRTEQTFFFDERAFARTG